MNMIRIESKVRKWGHSLGLIIPKNEIKTIGIKPGDDVDILLRKRSNVLRETFGTAKFKRSAEEIMKETDKLLYND